ncbi:unnamed protein product [Cyberlindnera jadinii]|uniref:Uncharacterized protein n=1 Tax=Cyberlindnera jadinii (strain ATCC 18201 / CBS 1600 / BCRC 20928 / JCM 3617 / NBRC 0987 / NRRL Y-1542) TaxID=983966 RepID=A0A0H5CI44_CYBJN|nr:unnamed protein product [Cyberlindnera jadinii]
MDYNLKQENRKKFQDKQRLKRHHKKDYSKVVKPSAEEAEAGITNDAEPKFDDEGNEIEDPEGKPAVGNSWRYKEELTVAGLDDESSELIKQIDFKKLSSRGIDLGTPKKDRLAGMTDDQLLHFRFNTTTTTTRAETKSTMSPQLHTSSTAQHRAQPQPRPNNHTKTPANLQGDQSFLDDLI